MFGWKSKKMKKLEELETKLDALTNQLSSMQNCFLESCSNNHSDLKKIIEDSDSKTQQMILLGEDNSRNLFSELGSQITLSQNEQREQTKELVLQLLQQDGQFFDSLYSLLDIQTQDSLERFKALTRQVQDLSVCEKRYAETNNNDMNALKKKLEDMQSEIEDLKINQENLSSILRDLERRQEHIHKACIDMQSCIASSEQLLRLLLINNVMDEIPDKTTGGIKNNGYHYFR